MSEQRWLIHFAHAPSLNGAKLGQARLRVWSVSPFCLCWVLTRHASWQAESATKAAGALGYIAVSRATGNGSAVSNADGGYTVIIVDGKGPCLLTATKGATVLRSVTSGAGVANLLSSANGHAILGDATALANAQTALVALIQTTYGLTITPGFLTATITTPQGGTQSPADKDLDNLLAAGAVSAVGTPVPALVTSVVTEAQKAPYVAPTGGTGSST